MSLDRFPRDWRTAAIIVVGTLGVYFAVQKWVVAIARAEDAPHKTAIEEMRPMVRQMFWACVRRGECEQPKEAR